MAGSQMRQEHWGKEGQIARREGMGGCMRARWQLLGWHGAGVQDGGQAGARSGGKGQSEAR